MKTYTKKIAFGLVLTVSFSLGAGFLALQENANEMWYAIAFLIAMKAGVDIWIILLIRERKERKEENFRRKNK